MSVSPYGHTFVTGEQGLGHVVLSVPPTTRPRSLLPRRAGLPAARLDATAAELVGRPAGDKPAWLRFFGCNPRHHSLAFLPMPTPTGIVHLMIETASLDDVGQALDRCARRGAPVSGTLGWHACQAFAALSLTPPLVLFCPSRYAAANPGTGPAEVVDTLLAWPRHADWM